MIKPEIPHEGHGAPTRQSSRRVVAFVITLVGPAPDARPAHLVVALVHGDAVERGGGGAVMNTIAAARDVGFFWGV
jgi:hypothetical protein